MTDEVSEIIANINSLGCWYERPLKKSRRQFFYGATGDRSRPVVSHWLSSTFGRTPLLACGEGSTPSSGIVICTGTDLRPRSKLRNEFKKPRHASTVIGKRRCLWVGCGKVIMPTHAGDWYCSECRKQRDAVGYTKDSYRIQGVR